MNFLWKKKDRKLPIPVGEINKEIAEKIPVNKIFC